MDNTAISRIINVFGKASSGAIILPANPSIDAVAAASALYLGITKIGKSVALVCETSVNFDLVAAEKFKKDLGVAGDNLVISFPYSDGSIDKVDYNIQGNLFNLIVTPRPGFSKLDPSKVKFTYSGGIMDFIIVIDAPSLNNLASIYNNNQAQFQGKELINIDRHLTNTSYGTINYLNKTSSSLCEMILLLLQQLQLEIDRDMATNLYVGIAAATNNFSSYSVTADTFEKIASLLRLGAIKKNIKNLNLIPQLQNRERNITKAPQTVEKESQPEEGTPADWLRPKIFKGGGLV